MKFTGKSDAGLSRAGPLRRVPERVARLAARSEAPAPRHALGHMLAGQCEKRALPARGLGRASGPVPHCFTPARGSAKCGWPDSSDVHEVLPFRSCLVPAVAAGHATLTFKSLTAAAGPDTGPAAPAGCMPAAGWDPAADCGQPLRRLAYLEGGTVAALAAATGLLEHKLRSAGRLLRLTQADRPARPAIGMIAFLTMAKIYGVSVHPVGRPGWNSVRVGGRGKYSQIPGITYSHSNRSKVLLGAFSTHS